VFSESGCREGLEMEMEAMEKILSQVPNRYEAIRITAKEARRVNALIKLSGEEIEEKPTTIAIRRLVEGKVKYAYAEQEGEK
jgi:DNA-directed RNA polymerase omega subunit